MGKIIAFGLDKWTCHSCQIIFKIFMFIHLEQWAGETAGCLLMLRISSYQMLSPKCSSLSTPLMCRKYHEREGREDVRAGGRGGELWKTVFAEHRHCNHELAVSAIMWDPKVGLFNILS